MATLPLDGGALWYESTGDGPPLVCIHGGWMDGEAWRALVDRFAREYRVITLDVRGHGRTGATAARRYSIDLFTDDLERLLDHLGIDRPVLCGLSLGGMIVQRYLDRHPDRAAGAIIAGPLRSMPPVALPPGMKPLLSPLPSITASLAMTGSGATFRSLLGSIRSVTGGPWLSVDRGIRSDVIDAAGGMPNREFEKVFGALYGFVPPDLSHVSTPVLVLYGDREAGPVKRQGRDIAATVGDGRWREIPGAGHLVNQDRPDAFNAAVSEFLDGLDADGGRPGP